MFLDTDKRFREQVWNIVAFVSDWLIKVAIFSHTRFSSFKIPSTLKYGPSFAFLGNLESISEFKGL